MKSALIKNEDIKDLPRFRSRTSINPRSSGDMDIDHPLPDDNENTYISQIDQLDSPPIHKIKPFSKSIKIEKVEDFSREENTKQASEDSTNDSRRGDGFENDSYEHNTSQTNAGIQLNQESNDKPAKRGRGRPRKIVKDDEIAATPKIKRKRGRPRKGTEEASSVESNLAENPRRSARIHKKDIPSYRFEKESDDNTVSKPAHRKRKASSRHESKKPVSLVKTRPSETQKPMYINTERIITNQNRDKRLRVNTLDVLKHLIENFNPITSDSQIVNESLVHTEFKTHVLHHLGYLFDAHANIHDISQEINEIQKKKTELRNRIFELKKRHTNVGSELNKMRGNYQNERAKFKNFNKMANKLQTLSSTVDASKSGNLDSSEELEQINKNKEAIDKEIFSVSKIVNPNSGMFKKLILINKKLSKIESELS